VRRPALAQRPRIFLAVGVAEVAPVATRMTDQKRFKTLSGLLQGLQGARGGGELA